MSAEWSIQAPDCTYHLNKNCYEINNRINNEWFLYSFSYVFCMICFLYIISSVPFIFLLCSNNYIVRGLCLNIIVKQDKKLRGSGMVWGVKSPYSVLTQFEPHPLNTAVFHLKHNTPNGPSLLWLSVWGSLDYNTTLRLSYNLCSTCIRGLAGEELVFSLLSHRSNHLG